MTMKRSIRAEMAQETVAICKVGRYTNRDGADIEIGPAVAEAIAGTELHSPKKVVGNSSDPGSVPAKWEVTDETTIGALRRLAANDGGHLACLNFASAKNPGGGVLGGSEAQEESLARSSALYPCLLAAPAYYERNRACRTALYLDLAIWSPAVPFFRDDEGQLLDQPYEASVITAPAPNAGAIATNEPARLDEVEPTLSRRAEFVLGLASAQGVRRLVLGAWGCGVFRNDPQRVAQVFHQLLASGGVFAGAFDQITFAIYDRSADRHVLRTFEEVFA
jgi:uncharacterized protein (TIGR02452 family)